MKALVDVDKDEKLCSPTIMETAEKVAEKITQQNPSLNPNEIVKNIEPVTEDKTTSTIDNKRRDAPKEMSDVGVGEQKNSSATGVEK